MNDPTIPRDTMGRLTVLTEPLLDDAVLLVDGIYNLADRFQRLELVVEVLFVESERKDWDQVGQPVMERTGLGAVRDALMACESRVGEIGNRLPLKHESFRISPPITRILDRLTVAGARTSPRC
jgi:hypothetical protein